MSHPPRLATLLNWLAPGNEALRGDLDEEFSNGRGSRWYWRQVASLLAHEGTLRIRGRAVAGVENFVTGLITLTLLGFYAVFVVNVTDWLLRFEGVQVLLRFPNAFGPFNGVAPILALALGAVTGRTIATGHPIASSCGHRRVRRRDDAARRGAQGSDNGRRTGAVSSGCDTAGRHDRDVRAWVGRRHYDAGDPAANRAPRIARETVMPFTAAAVVLVLTVQRRRCGRPLLSRDRRHHQGLQAHRLVAITDPHGNAGMRDFLRRLVADPRFADTVNDIVLEIGNARYQSLVDDYVNSATAGDALEAWLNTTVANQISADVELFRMVRRINAGQPVERRLRLLLGDPPIDWSLVKTREDHFDWLAQRDGYPAALVQTQVLARGRKGLIIYGHMHFQRRNAGANFALGDWRFETIVSLIERAGPTRVFTIWRLKKICSTLRRRLNLAGAGPRGDGCRHEPWRT